LLRVLEDGSMRRIGSTKERKVKVRLIAATNRDLGREVAEGRFREDLYYRVNVLSMSIPPLRERYEDIPLLIHHWLGEDWKLGNGVSELFRSYTWPGNVRQLINALERAKILSDNKQIEVENLPTEIQHSSSQGGTGVAPSIELRIGDAIPLESLSHRHVTEVLKRNRGNKTRAAKELGIARRSLYRILDSLAAKDETGDHQPNQPTHGS
jgi:transcriptional regulator with PAS, ATPase and Fis domain